MARDQVAEELERFFTDRADQLMRTAVLLAGSRDAGQDLLQTALERLMRHGNRQVKVPAWHGIDPEP